jgi:hypothetical protein
MKLGKDNIISIEKHTEKYRNEEKHCYILTTTNFDENNVEDFGKSATIFTKIVLQAFSETRINIDENAPAELLPKKSSVFFDESSAQENFQEKINLEFLKSLKKLNIEDLEDCIYFDDNLFNALQTFIFSEFKTDFENRRLISKTSAIDFKNREFYNFQGFDTEFVDVNNEKEIVEREFNHNDVDMSSDTQASVYSREQEYQELISMQFSRKIGKIRINSFVIVENYARFEFNKIIIAVDNFIRKLLYLKEFMFKTTMLAHFGIVDYSKFEKLKTEFNLENNYLTNIRKCLVTSRRLNVYEFDKNRNKKVLSKVHLRDTMLLDNPKSLKKLGQELGFKKISIGDKIKNMKKFLNEDIDKYYNYAIRDSEITLELAENYYSKELFDDNFILTVASQSSKLGKKLIMNHFAFNEEEYSKYFQGKHKVKGYKKTTTKFFDETAQQILISANTYYGGRNETYRHGIFEGSFIDIDTVSFYPNCASMIPFLNLFEVPYSINSGIVNDRTFDFNKIEVGMCQINFEYDEDTQLTGIPIFLEEYGIIYVKSGQGVWCSVQEIKSAFKNGAKIEIISGFVFKTIDNLENPLMIVYDSMLKLRKQYKEKYGKGSSEEKKQKLLNNSLYGKLGQGIKHKKSYNIKTDRTEEIVESDVSSACYANATTSIARAVITELMLLFSRYNKSFKLCNVVTDGFLIETDKFYDDDELNQIIFDNYKKDFYPNLSLFIKQLQKQQDTENIRVVEQKHSGKKAILIKTRGTVLYTPDEIEKSVQLSLTGFKFSSELSELSDYNKAEFIENLFKTRKSRVEVKVAKLLTAKTYRRNKSELSKTIYKKFSFNYDFKRKKTKETEFENVIRFETECYENIEEFRKDKLKYEQYKDIQIKSTEDFERIDSINKIKDFSLKINKNYTSEQILDRFILALAKAKKLKFNSKLILSYDDVLKIYELNNRECSFDRDYYRRQKVTENFITKVDMMKKQAENLLDSQLNGSFEIITRKELNN